MLSALRTFFLLTSCNFLLPVSAGPSPNPVDEAQTAEFHHLLNALPAGYLHSALQNNLGAKFREGVWEHARRAMEAVHRDNPPLASRVLADAALELIKRQNLNGTTTDPTPIVTPTPTPSSSQAVIVPIIVSTTNSRGSSMVTTSSVIAPPTVSLASTLTTTDSAGSTVTSATTQPAAVIVSDGMTTTALVSRFIQTEQMTDADGSVFLTTFTPDATNINSLVLITTTLPNGVRSTITSYAPFKTPSSTTTSTTNGPKLQGGAGPVGRPYGAGCAVVALGVMVGALLLF